MAKKIKRPVEILFNGLTHAGKIYRAGDIEKNPTPHLIECAEKKVRYFHRDEGRKIRICRYTTKTGTSEDKLITIDDLDNMSELDLVRVLVKKFGFSRTKVSSFPRERMEDYILRLQE